MSMLQAIAVAPEPVLDGPWGRTVLLRGSSIDEADAARRIADGLKAGECVAFAIQLNGSPLQRARALAGFRWRQWRIERVMRRAGATRVVRFGVDPDLDMPSCIYELGTDAAVYADRCLRPRGRLNNIRRWIEALAGCDPALGAVVITGRKQGA
jgi:hypothetical protein